MQNPQIFQKVIENRSNILIWQVALQYSNRVVIYFNKLILVMDHLRIILTIHGNWNKMQKEF